MSIRKFLKDNLPPNALNVARNCSYKSAYEYHKIANPEYVLKKMFKARLGYSLDLDSPKTFNEKLQWLKLHDNNPLYTTMVDKYAVKQYVAEKIGEQYIIPTLGIWEHFDEIDFDKLPNQFVLKLTKGSGYNLICNDKSKLDITQTRKMLRDWLNVNCYYFSREPQYKGKSKLVAEEMLEYNITDYKFFCFNGQPEFVELYIDRFGNHKKLFCDMDWNVAGFTTANDVAKVTVEQPKEFAEMKEVAKKLCKGMTFVRVDLYVHGGKVYFGEMTFHPAGGYTPITPREWEYKLGDMIKI